MATSTLTPIPSCLIRDLAANLPQRLGREERMYGRLRGAQRHQVEDISFGIFPLDEAEEPAQEPGLGPEPAPLPAGSPTLGTNRELPPSSPEVEEAPAAEHAVPSGTPTPPASRNVTVASSSRKRGNLYDMPDNTEDEVSQHSARRLSARRITHQPPSDGYDEVTESPVGAPGSGHRRRVRISAAASQTASVSLQEVLLAEAEPEHVVASSSPLERKTRRARSSLGTASTRLSAGSDTAATSATAAAAAPSVSGARLSARLSQASSAVRSGEVEESPEVASGPGQAIPSNDTIVDNVDELSPGNPAGASSVVESSPAARALEKRRASAGLAATRTMARRGRQNARPPSVDMDIDELSPKQPSAPDKPAERGSLSARASLALAEIPEEADEVEEAQTPSRVEASDDISEQNEESPGEAEEVDDQEAARKLGRKRLRRSFPAPSPELGSAAEETVPRPPKRRRGAPVSSPSRQNQPPRPQRAAAEKQASKLKQPPKQKELPKQKEQPKQKEPPPKQKGPPRQRAKKKTAPPPLDSGPEVEVSGEPISVPVQRFTRFRGAGGDESDEDELVSGIPFASRDGVTSVDILRQLCEEVTVGVLRTLREKAGEAEDAATRRELKTKIRALEAFREELRTKLIEHTIALDSLHMLKKRLRASQKEKRSLRDEILRLRAERDQVALRMDALRLRHGSEAQKVLRNIQISSAMHDIELAVDEGRSAPELSAADKKRAELENLELLMHRVGGQLCAGGPGTGVLDQVKSFNAYLERAAAALQAR
ncbi:hypothetical protein RB601_006285 [Gaeumannomyces tritici]